ncbi:hypothetical protein CDAR_486741 [Caerostris darwini]|uniref:Uncharacterized protein n=1 Tax=Caerostris darwini TaxID=1538125 RepID=A0AAV4NZS6_9ARAC|nr:hypothetical protein CDAR_486741 [Caerostris darwini]
MEHPMEQRNSFIYVSDLIPALQTLPLPLAEAPKHSPVKRGKGTAPAISGNSNGIFQFEGLNPAPLEFLRQRSLPLIKASITRNQMRCTQNVAWGCSLCLPPPPFSLQKRPSFHLCEDMGYA